MPVMRDVPKEAEIVSHQLMLRTGMVRQSSAGIYSWLPLGLRVLRNIEQIVRDEQNRAGALEVLMPTIQPAELWQESGRYEDYGKEMLRIEDRHGRDMLYGPTNEEQITQIFRDGVRSYRECPRIMYHIQWKFRDEVRPRFGVMRGREFLMKDGYSFDLTVEDGRRSYNRMFVSYLRTFERMGLKAIPMVAETGPIGGDQSHEFIILAETGESEVFCDADLIDRTAPGPDVSYDDDLQPIVDDWTGRYAATSEEHDQAEFDTRVPKDRQVRARGIEVGHIFFFGDKYSEPMGARVQGPDGKLITFQSGSYGIGVSRLAGGIIEACHDEAGIKWPMTIAPFHVGLVNLRPGDTTTDQVCEDLYARLHTMGATVLYDDTDERAGTKFTTMDLIGLPYQLIVGPKGLKDGHVELKERATGERHTISPDSALGQIADALRAVSG